MKKSRDDVSDNNRSSKRQCQGGCVAPTAAPIIVYNVVNMQQGSILNYFASASSAPPVPPAVPTPPSGKDDKEEEEEEDTDDDDDDDTNDDETKVAAEVVTAAIANKLDLSATDMTVELQRCIELVNSGVNITNLEEVFSDKTRAYNNVIKGHCNNKLKNTLLSSWMHNVKHADVTMHTVMKSGNRLNNDSIIEMKCIRCHVYHPRDPLHFMIANGLKKLFTSKNGFESLQNSVSTPCLECQMPMFRMARSYKKDGITEEILKAKLDEQGGRCLITNVVLVNKTHARNNAINLCRVDNGLGHTPDNSYFAIANVNPQQHDAIEDLRVFYPRIWRHIIDGDEMKDDTDDIVKRKKALITNLTNTPAQNGVSANCMTETTLYFKQMNDLHMVRIIGKNVSALVSADVKAGRLTFKDAKCKAPYIKKAKETVTVFLKAHPTLTCSVIGLPLTITNGPFRLSLDRNDDSLPHFGVDGNDMSNINLRGRVFNTNKKMTKKLLLTYTLSQITVPMTAQRRLELKRELAMM
jgi:hypothetical protein